jgi:uncharacterized protein DUF6599
LYKLSENNHRKSASVLLAAIFSLISQLTPIQTIAQDRQASVEKNPVEATSDLLPDGSIGEWRALGRARILKAEEWSVLPDATIYSEYGLQRLHSRVYTKGSARATVEIFEMRFPSGAYGLYTFNRGSLSPNRREIYLGNFLASIDSSLKDKEFDSAFVELLKKNPASQSSGKLPLLPSHLPGENKIADSEKYLVGPAALAQQKAFSGLKDVIKFDSGVEAVSADYKNGDGTMSLMIIEYQTPQTAADGLKAVSKYIETLNHAERESRILKRVGNYLVHAVNVKNSTDAGNLISQIKYEYKVYWEGRKISDVPLEFRPPDPVAIDEANRTLMIMVRSFYWVGALLSGSILIGLVAGGTFFYFRRYRRRKLGLDELFSDAGGTIRLNLDDYLLDPGQPAVKQLSDGK